MPLNRAFDMLPPPVEMSVSLRAASLALATALFCTSKASYSSRVVCSLPRDLCYEDIPISSRGFDTDACIGSTYTQ